MDPNDGVFAHLRLRSATPPPAEKVLSFLQKMTSEDGGPESPPRSMIDHEEYRSRGGSARSGGQTPRVLSPGPPSKGGGSLLNGNGYLHFETKSNGHYEDDHGDDADSNVQEGMRSELGEIPVIEPGPHDPPGPRYESYDSGPSFGNLGALPEDQHPPANPYSQASWNPDWNQIIQANGSEGGQAGYPSGLTSGQPLNGSLSEHGASPRQTPGNGLYSPSQKSRASVRSPEPTSPKPASRATNRPGEDRPWSPLSGRSKATGRGSAYPPLPESRVGDGESAREMNASPQSRAMSPRAPSLSPSDSPSQGLQMFANQKSRSGSAIGHQSRPFSPYRHAPTQEDLLNAAVRGRALVIPPEPIKESSVSSQSPSKVSSKVSSKVGGKGPSQLSKSASHQPSPLAKTISNISVAKRSSDSRQRDRSVTPTRPASPDQLDDRETQIVNDALAARTPRTSYYEAPLDSHVVDHYHDHELCVLLQRESDPSQHEFVRKALRKAIRQRIKKLGMKYDNESIKLYRKSYHDHDPEVHLQPANGNASTSPGDEEAPVWASDLKRELLLMQQRIESLGPKIESLRSPIDRSFAPESRYAYEPDSARTPMTQTVNIETRGGTNADSMYRTQVEDMYMDEEEEQQERTAFTETDRRPYTDGETMQRSVYGMSEAQHDRDDSPGHQYLEEELYKLRQRKSNSAMSHRSWELARKEDHDEPGFDTAIPTIPDTNPLDERETNDERSLPDLPVEAKDLSVRPQGQWNSMDYNKSDGSQTTFAPWQKIHARLLDWAMIWPMSELEASLNSTLRGQQVDEVALSIWSTQTYKRYVRARLTDQPQGQVDRLFVPPNMADSINNAVFHGRHGEASRMLENLWTPFGLEGMPRLLIVLAKHRTEANHWVVHRFCLPDGTLTTYDSYPERTLPDGRPLGWWFAIRVAWPNCTYPSPDNLVQKMVRLHRPMQAPIDNSVAAAGIWRNLLMGSRAERSLDLERLRDLVNTEVKNLKQRKHLGKLSIGAPKPGWEDLS